MPMTGGSPQSALQKFRATAIEARIADVPATDDDAAVVATLIQGLSSPPTALLRGYTPSPVDTHAAYWRAARDGIDGHGIDPVSGHLVPATDPILRLLDHLRPALGRTSDYHRAHQAHQRSSPAAPAPSSNAAPSEQAHRRTRST
jgi:gamma-glutamyl:cysteine ligase YbdK (ATP-grasp superfamily)